MVRHGCVDDFGIGILLRISRTTEKCNHPYAEPFSAYCVGQCTKADPGSVYPPAKVFAQQCKFDVSRPTREVPKDDGKKDEEKKPDAKEEKKDATPTESSTQVPASTPSSAAPKDAPSSTASSISSASPTPATSAVSPASPVSTTVSAASPTGTGAPGAAVSTKPLVPRQPLDGS